jgi:hypothetical protein
MTTLARCCRAWLVWRLAPLARSRQHALELGIEPSLKIEKRPPIKCPCQYNNEHNHLKEMPKNLKEILGWYSQPPQGVGRKARLTPLTAINAIGELDEIDATILVHNKQWVDFSVASTLIYYAAMPKWLRKILTENQWHAIPISQWKETLKPTIDEIVRFGLIKECETELMKSEAALWMRKVMTLTGRDLKPANYAEDLEKTKAGKAVHFAPIKNTRKMSITHFSRKLWLHINLIAREIMTELLERADLKEIGDWWKERWKWTPAGSSSMRHNLDKVRNEDERIRKSDRPNKKTVVETIEIGQIMNVLMRKHNTSHARMSTKPEPGFKRRVLYALDDVNNHISAYAATEMEKYMNIGGMVAKQTPVDVINWWKATATKNTNVKEEWWASLDYSDFNKDHSRIDLALVELAFSKQWGKKQQHANRKLTKIAIWKRLAGTHTGVGHLNAWSEEMELGVQRNFSGLWSGHRTTARDNTMLHLAYFRCIKDIAWELFGEHYSNRYIGICGDDEDAIHKDWVAVAIHLGLHKLCGFSINPAKQRVDTMEHEFLQRNARNMEMPQRPIANVLAALSTGTWYKEAKIGIDRNASELVKNFQEAVNRGANGQIMRKTAMRILNALYTLTINKQEIKLDWWPIISKTAGESIPLFGEPARKLVLEFPKIELDLPKDIPKMATNDWVNKHGKWFSEKKMLENYQKMCLKETYKA